MSEPKSSTFDIGQLIVTRNLDYSWNSENTFIQCWPGWTAEEFRANPENFHISDKLSANLRGQVIDKTVVELDKTWYDLIKILVVDDTHPKIVWVLPWEISPLEN